MRKIVPAALLLVLLAPAPLLAQSVISIAPQQCVWHPGDDPAWAAPNLDESGWQPYADWKLDPREPHYWVRCHADLSSLKMTAQPAVQVRLYAAYELYLNGQRLGNAGNLRTGNFSMNSIRSWPVDASRRQTRSQTAGRSSA